MLVKVQYTTQLKAAIGQSEEPIELANDATLSDLIQQLVVKHAETFSRLVLDSNGNLLPSILLCVDDEQVSGDLSTALADGSVVTFLSAISGG